ncbi:MAG: nitroreductase family protein [Phycisphaerae bacterium]|jgi:nitroreductase
MTVLEVIRKRYACRAYIDKPIEREKLDQIFEAARLAPSAKNLQDWRFVAVSEKSKKQQVAASTNHFEVFEKAGVIIAACSNSNYIMKCGQAAAPIDVAIALEHICLQATELGLATCWIGSFEPEIVRKVLNVPQDISIIELMAVGYPADKAKNPSREPIENIVCYNKWQF